MKRNIVASLLLSVAILGLAACSSDKSSSTDTTTQAPPPKKADKPKGSIDQRLTIGMSKDDVIAACGNPKGKSVNGDGTEAWMYNDQEKAFMPYYSLSGGKITYTTIIFDANGKVKNWTSSSQGRY